MKREQKRPNQLSITDPEFNSQWKLVLLSLHSLCLSHELRLLCSMSNGLTVSQLDSIQWSGLTFSHLDLDMCVFVCVCHVPYNSSNSPHTYPSWSARGDRSHAHRIRRTPVPVSRTSNRWRADRINGIQADSSGWGLVRERVTGLSLLLRGRSEGWPKWRWRWIKSLQKWNGSCNRRESTTHNK